MGEEHLVKHLHNVLAKAAISLHLFSKPSTHHAPPTKQVNISPHVALDKHIPTNHIIAPHPRAHTPLSQYTTRSPW